MADKVNLQKSYSALNEKLAKQFDESGVKRSFTVPYIDGQGMTEHVQAVGAAAAQAGGLTKNLLTTMHHSEGKGWGSGDGHTVGHPADSLRSTIIPKDNEHAKATIDAAQTHLNNIKKLLGDEDPTVKVAQGQLNLVKKGDGAGMNLLDFGVMLVQVMHAPNQAVARAHNDTKSNGAGHPKLQAPGSAPQEPPEGGAGSAGGGAGEPQPAQEGAEPAAGAQPEAAAGAAAPEAQAAPGAAPATPQA